MELEPLEAGVMFWAGGALGTGGEPAEIVRAIKSLGVRCGQLGVHGEADLGPESQQAWKRAQEENGFGIVTVFTAYPGESYADVRTVQETVGFVPRETRREREQRTLQACDFAKAVGASGVATVQETVGFVPRETRREREQRTLQACDFAKAVGASGVATHIGFVPEDRSSEDYEAVRDVVRRICDRCGELGLTFALETGQESAAALKQFIEDVDRINLGINFDPANMILYGSGEPLEALEMVKDWVITVHCKDGVWPKQPGQLGEERPLGQGDVGMDRFVAKLKEIAYKGPLTIEREITGEQQRKDIQEAIALLNRLRAA